MGERLLCTEEVRGSSPLISMSLILMSLIFGALVLAAIW